MNNMHTSHVFEIYTRNPDDHAVTGWDISWVQSTRELIKSYPLFDVIITTDDMPAAYVKSLIIWDGVSITLQGEQA